MARENEDYINWLKYFVAVTICVVGSYWYGSRAESGPESLSVFLLCVYFAVVLFLCKLAWSFQYCLRRCLPKHSMRGQLRVYLYTTRHNVLRAYFPDTIGESLDLFIVLLSVGSCLMYVAETYFPFLVEETSWQVVELTISVIFLVDYLMRITLAVNMLQYALSLFGVINVVTVLPVLVYTSDRLFKEATGTLNPSVGSGTKLTYLRLLRLAKLLRILRSMNVVKSSSAESVRREMSGLIFTVLTMIFSAAGVYQWLENDDNCFSVDFKNTLNVDDYTKQGVYAKHGCVYFHEAFYWCTIEVLGRPRMIMREHTTILMLVGLVTLSVILIPRHLASLVAALQTSNVYQRQSYRAVGRKGRHLVIVGHREFASINMLLYEIFHPDRGDEPYDVVLLFSTFPDRDTLALLAHPAYIGRVVYLEGSPLNEKDLMRASLGTAAGVIVLANKDSDMPHWHDGELLTCIQSMKAFWLRDTVQEHGHFGGHFGSSREAKKYLRPRIVAQILLPETKEYLVELPGWKEDDVVVVCSEYTAWLTAMASMARGMATVAFNLTSHTEMQRSYRTKWYPRYEAGATQEIYARKVKEGGQLDQCDVIKASEILSKKRVLLIGFERRTCPEGNCSEEDETEIEDGIEGVHLFPGPKDFILKAGDVLLCIAQSGPALQRSFATSFSVDGVDPRVPEANEELPGRRLSLRSISNATRSVKRIITARKIDKARTWITNLTDKNDENDQLRSEITFETHSDDEFLNMNSHASGRSYVPRGCEDVYRYVAVRTNGSIASRDSSGSETAVVELVRKPTEIIPMTPTTPKPPLTAAKAKKAHWKALHDKLSATEPPWNRHVVICGLPQTQVGRDGGRGLVTSLIETLLESNNVGPWPLDETKVCIIDTDAVDRMADLCILEERLMDAVKDGKLRAVSADPRKREALTSYAAVHSAMTVVALPEHINQALTRKTSVVEMKDGINRPKMMKQIIDTNTVLTMEVARGCSERVRRQDKSTLSRPSLHENPIAKKRKLHCVTLLLQESTTNLFYGHANMRHSGAAVHDQRWMDISPLNMSPLFASGELVAMTCCDRFAVEAMFTPQIVPFTKMFLFGDANRHHLYQIYCPPEFVKRSYAKLVEQLRDDRQIAIAILRSPNKHGQTFIQGEPTDHENLMDATFPYVITNPEPSTIVLQETDLIFIIGNRGESDLIRKQDSKGDLTQSPWSGQTSGGSTMSLRPGDESSFAVGQKYSRPTNLDSITDDLGSSQEVIDKKEEGTRTAEIVLL